jgi:hypothetical protein
MNFRRTTFMRYDVLTAVGMIMFSSITFMFMAYLI